MLPYYLVSEDNGAHRSSAHHGVGGPVKVSSVQPDVISLARTRTRTRTLTLARALTLPLTRQGELGPAIPYP